jgi:hypothetical protein
VEVSTRANDIARDHLLARRYCTTVLQSPAPAPPGACHRPRWCRSLANGTEHDQDFILKLTYRGL